MISVCVNIALITRNTNSDDTIINCGSSERSIHGSILVKSSTFKIEKKQTNERLKIYQEDYGFASAEDVYTAIPYSCMCRTN